MRAHQKHGISKLAVEPLRYYAGEIKPHWQAHHADWMNHCGLLRRCSKPLARTNLANCRKWRLLKIGGFDL